jgi:TPP-dependent indolepyruvate ferredoxin oxidoreductase alpha subunit
VEPATLVRSAGVDSVQVVDLDGGGDIAAALEEGVQAEGVAVVIARGACVRRESPTTET